MSGKHRGQGSGGQQGGASSGPSREANQKPKKNSGSRSYGGTDTPKLRDEGDDVPQHTKPSLVATTSLTINTKVCRIYCKW